MAKKVLIDELVSPQIFEQLTKLNTEIQKTSDLIQKLNQKGTGIGSDSATISDAAKKMSEYEKSYNNVINLTSKYNNLKSEEGRLQAELAESVKKNIKALQDEISGKTQALEQRKQEIADKI